MRTKALEHEKKENAVKTQVRQLASALLPQGMAASLLSLQRSHGNRFVQRLLQAKRMQAKLTISEPGDRYEQEADRVAEAVMRMPEPIASGGVAVSEQVKDVHTQPPGSADAEHLHRQTMEEEMPEEEEETLQAKEVSGETPEVTPELEAGLNSARGGGQALPESVRAFFEPRFGYDFGGVRVHTDGQAVDSARSVKAHAYTLGQDIVFASGQYAPETPSGKQLLAHELTHVVQQRGSRSGADGASAVAGRKAASAAAIVARGGEAPACAEAEGPQRGPVPTAHRSDHPRVAERDTHAPAGPLLSGEPVSVEARFPEGRQIMRTLQSAGIRVEPIEDVWTEANAWVDIDAVEPGQAYRLFQDIKPGDPVRYPVPKLRPGAKGKATIQVRAYADIPQWYNKVRRYLPNRVRASFFGDLTELGTHIYQWPLEADQNGMLVKVGLGHVHPAQGHAAGRDIKFTAEVKDFFLLAAFSATSSSIMREETSPGTTSETTIGGEGKVGVDKLKDKLPKLLQWVPLPSGDVAVKVSEKLNVASTTTKKTETTAARNPSGSYQMELQRGIPAAPAPAPAGGSGGPTNITNIRVGDVNINPPAPKEPEKPQPTEKPPTTTTRSSPSFQAGAEGKAELTGAERRKVHGFITNVEAAHPDAWRELFLPFVARPSKPLIFVKGHASDTGTPEFNEAISRERAEIVKRYLVKQVGIQEDCIIVQGSGAYEAKKTGPSAEERYVEIKLSYRGGTYSSL